jgi:glycosyltransferase involved in cell wall biosynthesis
LPALPFPTNTGDRVYSLGLIRALAPRVRSLTVIGIADPEATAASLPHLTGVTWAGLFAAPRRRTASLLSKLPYVTARYSPTAVAVHAGREIRRNAHDVIVLDQYASGWALDALDDLLLRRGRVVYVAHNYETAVATTAASQFRGNAIKRILLHRNVHKIAALETRLAREADTVFTITEEDKVRLHGLGTRHEPIVLAPGIDMPALPPHPLAQSFPRRLVLLGSFEWTPKQINLVRFLDEAQCALSGSQLSLDIIGKMPRAFLRALRRRHAWANFLGPVESLDQILLSYHLGLNVEQIGGGFKLKTLTYIAHGVPVAGLASALTGVAERLRQCMIVRDNNPYLIAAILGSTGDLNSLERFRRSAHAVSRNNYSWEKTAALFTQHIG